MAGSASLVFFFRFTRTVALAQLDLGLIGFDVHRTYLYLVAGTMLCLPWLLRAVSYALLTSYSDLEDQTLYLYRPVVWLVSLPFMRAAGTVFALGAIALQLVWLGKMIYQSNRLWDAANSPGAEAQEIPEQQLFCPACSSPYFLSDYRSDVEHIYCSGCKGELPRSRATEA